ncbi:MAG: 50S ribosomal protein L17 [Deltaproteobacteria bacterium]|nr:50S ribosomal protein L17 [Deltaproteobacteria bacterium]MBW2143160.1 50S ribosomal protein L17 [Deltaproteobacteria bacterium]
MRHRKAGKQLSRNSSHRRALLRNMVTSLLKHERIETTDAKAKSVRPVAEKMITLAKRGDLHARRQALAYIQDKAVTHKLFDELKERYLDRQGGYIRIVKKGIRKGDGAPVSIVQLIPQDEEKKPAKKKARKPKKVSKAQPSVPREEEVVKKEEEVTKKVQDETPPETTDETAVEEPQEEAAVEQEVENVAEVPDEPPLKTDGEATAEEEKQEDRREDTEKDK